MYTIVEKLRRVKRRNRVPHGLLISAALMLLLVTMLSASVLALPASAKVRMHMPRTENGVVTDHDGIIDSTGMAENIPDVTDLLTNDGSAGTEGSDALDPVMSDTAGETTAETDPATTDGRTTDAVTTRPNDTTNAVDDMANDMGVRPWVIGLIVLSVLTVAAILIVWWVSGSRKR